MLYLSLWFVMVCGRLWKIVDTTMSRNGNMIYRTYAYSCSKPSLTLGEPKLNADDAWNWA